MEKVGLGCDSSTCLFFSRGIFYNMHAPLGVPERQLGEYLICLALIAILPARIDDLH